MNYIVLDIEWNQPYSKKCMVQKPVMLRGEIVQIGAVMLDENYHTLDTFKILVAPKHYTKMHRKVSSLTKITTEQLKYGFSFPVALKYFKRWCGEEFTFLTWGYDDINILRDNMVIHNINTSWLPNTYNIQVIFDDQIAKEQRQVSLSYAMEKIGEPVLEAHDALNDAKNTVCVCWHLDMVKGLAEYTTLQKKMRCHCKAVEESESAKTYLTRDEAFSDTELINFVYPTRGTNVKCEGFVRQNADKFICIGKCDNGDELFVRFKFTKCSDGRFRVTRIMHEMDEEKKAYYLRKKQRAEDAEAAYLESIAVAV